MKEEYPTFRGDFSYDAEEEGENYEKQSADADTKENEGEADYAEYWGLEEDDSEINDEDKTTENLDKDQVMEYDDSALNDKEKTTKILAIGDDDIDFEVTDEDQDQAVSVEPENTSFSNYEDTLFDYSDEEDVTNGLE